MKAQLAQCLLTLMLGAATLADEPAPQQSLPLVEINIAAQPLAKALTEFGGQTGLNVVIDPELSKGKTSPQLTGRYTPERALDLLLANTGLTPVYLNEHAVTLRQSQTKKSEPRPDPIDRPPPTHSVPGSPAREDLTEVVITGSKIPGASLSAGSPVTVYTRDDIDRSGASTAEQFMAQLTQNYGSGQSEYGTLRTLGTLPTQPNLAYGTGPNLRGLNSSSTLVLVDGHRLAPSGYAEFTDLSMIPFDAVDRVEVVTDGASALYGSDAVGGVVNFILRKDFKREGSVRLGSSTHGDSRAYDAFQAAGTDWDSGNMALSLQALGRGSITNQDRDFSRRDSTAPLAGPRDLLPGMAKDAATLSVTQEVTEAIQLSGDGLWSRRREKYQGCNAPCGSDSPSDLYEVHASNQEYEASLGLRAKLSKRWLLEATANSSGNWLDFVQTSAGNPPVATRTSSDLWNIEASMTGVLIESRQGDTKISAGLSSRNESFQFANYSSRFGSHSTILAQYTELQVPLLASASDLPAPPRATLTIAERYEHYSSFGAAFDPKAGLRVHVTPSMSLRGTYGVAFKAPNAYQLSNFNSGRYLDTLADTPSASGKTLALVRYGGNPDLRPQNARIWTLGLDWDDPSSRLRSQSTIGTSSGIFRLCPRRGCWIIPPIPPMCYAEDRWRILFSTAMRNPS